MILSVFVGIGDIIDRVRSHIKTWRFEPIRSLILLHPFA